MENNYDKVVTWTEPLGDLDVVWLESPSCIQDRAPVGALMWARIVSVVM